MSLLLDALKKAEQSNQEKSPDNNAESAYINECSSDLANTVNSENTNTPAQPANNNRTELNTKTTNQAEVNIPDISNTEKENTIHSLPDNQCDTGTETDRLETYQLIQEADPSDSTANAANDSNNHDYHILGDPYIDETEDQLDNTLDLSLDNINQEQLAPDNLINDSTIDQNNPDNQRNEFKTKFESESEAETKADAVSGHSSKQNAASTEADTHDLHQNNERAQHPNQINPEFNPASIALATQTQSPFVAIQNHSTVSAKQIRLIAISVFLALILVSAWWYLSNSLNKLSNPNVNQMPAHSTEPDDAMPADTMSVTVKIVPAKPAVAKSKVDTSDNIVKQDATNSNTVKPLKTIAPVVSNKSQAEKTVTVSTRKNKSASENIIYSNDNVYIADLSKNSAASSNTINIRKNQKQPETDSRLLSAYYAYKKGDLKKAKNDYSQYLKNNPLDRDALLGLAAIASFNKQYIKAHNYYYRLLQFNPKDSMALTGLLSLQKSSDIDRESTISKLKILINQDSNAPHLHFALGNLFLSDARRLEAQRAFFNAFHLDDSNPDYAYNLAVSLDQLNEPQAAIPYYRLAIQKSYHTNFSFNRLAAKKRLDYLRGKSK